jgi:hypothetical protein
LAVVSLLLYSALHQSRSIQDQSVTEEVLHIQYRSGRSQSCRTSPATRPNPVPLRVRLHLGTDHTPVGRLHEESTATRTSSRRTRLLPLETSRGRLPRHLAPTRSNVVRLLEQTPTWTRATEQDSSTPDSIGCSRLLHRPGDRCQETLISARLSLRMLCDNSTRAGKTAALPPMPTAMRVN